MILVVLNILFFLLKPCFAITLLTEKEALDAIFITADRISVETKIITDQQKERIKLRLLDGLDGRQKPVKLKEIMEQKEFKFYFGIKDEKKFGVVIILDEPGKWGAIQFIVNLGLNAEVKDVLLMKYSESRGRPIARRSFLKQFIGKTSKDYLQINKDIIAISGATISSESAVFSVKKAIILYEELFLK